MENTFNIELLEINWIDEVDDQTDLCAHGNVKLTIGNEIVVDKTEEMDHWNLRAMGMHLLRTLKDNHTEEKLVGEHLIPCCGHHIDFLENEKKVHIQGCFTGHNFWVRHENKKVELTTETGKTQIVMNFEEYKNVILDFVDKISDFYSDSLPRILPEDEYDKIAYSKFWDEWNERRTEWKKNAPQQRI